MALGHDITHVCSGKEGKVFDSVCVCVCANANGNVDSDISID